MKIFAVGMNYAAHNKELHNSLCNRAEPVIFTKADSALLTGGKPFFVPAFTQQCEYETEVVVRICRLGRSIAKRWAHRYYDQVTVGINPAHVDSEDHMESNMTKGWITAEDVARAKEIIATVSAEKAANLPAAMVENIAKGRLNKFLKENCLLSQEYIWDKNQTVEQYLKSVDKDLTVLAFKRFTLRAE